MSGEVTGHEHKVIYLDSNHKEHFWTPTKDLKLSQWILMDIFMHNQEN